MKRVIALFSIFALIVLCLSSYGIGLHTVDNGENNIYFSSDKRNVSSIAPLGIVSSYGWVDFTFENELTEIGDVAITLNYYFYSHDIAHIAKDIESYDIYINDKVVASFNDGPYPKENFISRTENGETFYPTSTTVIIPEELLSEEFGEIAFYIEGTESIFGNGEPSLDIPQKQELTRINSIYYKRSSNKIEFSKIPFRIKSSLFIDEIEQGQSDIELDRWRNQISEISKRYFVSCNKLTLFSGKIEGFTVKNNSDEFCSYNVAVGSRDVIGRLKIEYCTINEKIEKARFIYALTLNYKGDYSLEFSDSVGIDVLYVYLWDDGVVLQIGTGASNVMQAEISDAASILNMDVNSEIRSEIEKQYEEIKSVGKWNFNIKKSDMMLVNSEKRRIIATAEDGAEYIIYDEIPRVIELFNEFFDYLFEKIRELFKEN